MSDSGGLDNHEDDVPTLAIMRLADEGGAFDFWLHPAEDVYSENDGDPA